MDVVARLWAHGGIATRSQLTRTRAERRAVAAAVASGAVRDLGSGWVAVPDAEQPVVVARRLGATITCVSIAPYLDLQVLTPPDRPHVALPRGRGRRQVSLPARVHWESTWTAPYPYGLPLAPLAEALARALRCLPAEDAAVMVDSALRKRLVGPDEVRGMLVGRGSPAALAALDRCDARSRSAIETRARLALVDAGLGVSAGVTVDGVGEVDLLVEGHVVVECDGFAYHSGRAEYREDRRRDRALIAKGYLPLRFTWEEIMENPGVVVVGVLRATGRA